MVKPYYSDEYVTILHGDCRELLPTLPKVNLVLTDPPYGIGKDGQKFSTGKHGGRKAYEFLGWDISTPDSSTFKLIFSQSLHQIIWGANYFTPMLPATAGWIVWDKGQRINQSDGEIAFSSFDCALRIFTFNRVELMKDCANHPTQKPLRLITSCIEFAQRQMPNLQTICDPFMGSGTTLMAAKQVRLKAIGIEIEERYCEIAARRCEAVQPSLFDAPVAPAFEPQAAFFGEDV